MCFPQNTISERNVSLWNVFLRTAEKFPSNIAMTERKISLSYAELAEAAESFASSLKLGDTLSDFVVLLIPPGIQSIVASLATLSLNKIVLIIHDNYTNRQVEKCLAFLNHPPVVTTQVKWDTLDTVYGYNYQGLNLIPDQFEIPSLISARKYGSSETKAEIQTFGASGENAGHNGVNYCFFTSGSTGNPKAVLVQGSSIFNASKEIVGMDPETFTPAVRGLMSVTNSFVYSLVDVWPIFLCGGALVVPPSEIKLDMTKYRSWITQQQITAANFATPVLEMLLSKDVDKLTTLRRIAFSGARINPRRIQMNDASFILYHMYGSTEMFLGTICPISSTCQIVPTKVGKPIRNVRFYVVDEQGEEVKTSEVSGDLYVSGAGLLRGYYGQPELTAKALVSNRFEPDMGPMFATGDCGYWSSNGDLHLTGRKDDQVKIHGMRLELGEIEAVLCSFPGIVQSAVVVKESKNNSNNKQLVAFYTAEGQSQPSPEHLKQFLEQHLQPHAIPSRFIILDEFPKIPSGKINRVELKESVQESNESETDEDETEINPEWIKTVRSVWSEVLELRPEEIKNSDNFFYIGGNSILTFTVFERLKAVHSNLPSTTPFLLFKAPVLKDFAQALSNFQEPTASSSSIDFKAEIQLPTDIIVANSPAKSQNSAILVTGTTGFLGQHLLMDLLKAYPDSEIYSIVRAKTDDEARERLVASFQKNSLVEHMIGFERVRSLAGDLTKDKLGLSDPVYKALGENVKVIFHSAADVNFMKTYEQLRETTVRMTNNILRFALETSRKEFHFMSTIGVMDGLQESSSSIYHVKEGRIPAEVDPYKMSNGYNQSKWVSEQLVWDSVERGLIATTYRIGQVGSHTVTKLTNPSDAIAGFIVTCKKLGRYPNVSIKLPFVDGDVSETKINLSKIPRTDPESCAVFHLVGKEVGLEEFFVEMKDVCTVPMEQWEADFQKLVEPAPKTEDEINAWLFLQMCKNAEEQIEGTNQKSLIKNISFSVKDTVGAIGPKFQNVHPELYANLLCKKIKGL